ncbi:MAG TPA: long-chain fatty acid--CoA ligase [Acidobacteria bacterium]|nr:long-chain fatty acid--CoA ligase [Acidobacteriota bacterium]
MPETIMSVLERTAREHGDRPAMRVKNGGRWETTTWKEYRDQTYLAARGFIHLGLQPRQGVAIMGFNRPEWFLADLGAIAAGGFPAGIYVTNTADQSQYIADHAEAAVAVLENTHYLTLFQQIRDRLPHLKAIVLMTGAVPEGAGEAVYSWDQLLEMGAQVPESELRRRIEDQKPSDLCTLIYTSGTTGPPKAVMLTHDNVTWTAKCLVDAYGVNALDDLISYLPLSHIAEQVVSLHSPMAVGACSWFAESIEKLGENLREVRPHFFLAVPRVWEKMQAAIQAAGAQNTGLKKKISAWARGVGLAGGRAEQEGRPKPILYPLANQLVFTKVREKLGLDRARVAATSTAPISVETMEFFSSLGIPILEVYGMSECTGPTTFSMPDRYRFGSVGRAIPGSELKTAEDGEVLMRGPHVFPGYFKSEEATAEMLDAEGWLHSGDIGEIDAEGFLKITDRKKELIITSGGKNIAPSIIESKLRQIPAVSQAVVIGDRRHYLVALLTLDPTRAADQAKAAGSPATTTEAMSTCPKFRQYLEKAVEGVNTTLARYETIKKFVILPRELSIAEGELTPTMKLKRRVVNERFAQEIEGLYAG